MKSIESLEILLNAAPGSFHDVSVAWSTSHVPGMDSGYGAYCERGGMWRMRRGAFLLAGFLAMHSRCVAAFLGGGGIYFLLLLWAFVFLLASPMRYFELYLGQWSLSGPGRAFRYTPILDGVGMAIAVVCVMRAVVCCCLASSAAVYVWHSTSDDRLPFTYCRSPDESNNIKVCSTTFNETYPYFPRSPAYHYFYVRVWKLEDEGKEGSWNKSLLWITLLALILVWAFMLHEKIYYGKLVWNNLHSWVVVVPVMFVCVMLGQGLSNVGTTRMLDFLQKYTELRPANILVIITDALEVSFYIHSAAAGTEIILGKGLNHFASGHIDPMLSRDNVLHSLLLTLLVTVQVFAGLACSAADPLLTPQLMEDIYQQGSSTFWVLPMYSKCIAMGNHAHFLTMLLYGALVLSYIVCAYINIKIMLHCLFEYNIQLVFQEQCIAFLSVAMCFFLSVIVHTHGGVRALEAIEQVSAGLVLPFICLVELVALLYVYGGTDFDTDLQAASKKDCYKHARYFWTVLPFCISVWLILKTALMSSAPMPLSYSGPALVIPLLAVATIIARGIYNYVEFLNHRQNRT